MSKSEKLFEIGRTIDGRLEYYYNRKRGEKPVYLLTVDNKDGTIHIVKDIIHAPDVIVALISALKHAVEVLHVAKVFYPVLDDYVELFVDMWQKEYQKLVEEEESDGGKEKQKR
ncbi:hypothetical protein DRO49_01410 [Candidatus Bathyarchaeota archaeon]|nr:MAG: hypothetical protein DRO49_01410 [Candidatus Bathyarchaeota archaeon]